MYMRWVRVSIHLLIALMVLVPFFHYLESDSEASPAIPMGCRPGLLLTDPAPPPALDRIAQLDKLIITQYTVRHGEDIWSICHRFSLKNFAFTIRSSNDLDESPTAGTVLMIPNHVGTLYQVEKPQTLHEITSGFEVGRKGGPAYERQVLDLNEYPFPGAGISELALKQGTLLFLPNAFKPTGLPVPFHDMHFRITSGFGRRLHPVLGIVRDHKGMDLARPYGSPVYVSRAGTVTYAGWMGGYGNMIEIKHIMRKGKIRYTRYGHLSAILVHVGQHVPVGKLIGKVGSTGISTGPHLHYEVRDENGVAHNPAGSL
jgi:murein DD-endopeptidase MepM/ murein hydrolase activator NlpD